MQFPGPGPNLLEFLEAADTKVVAGLVARSFLFWMWGICSAGREKIHCFPKPSPEIFQIFLGKSKSIGIPPLWTVLVGSGCLC